MLSFTRIAMCTAVATALAGCGGLTQLQDSISKFDQGSHSAATAEMAYLRNVQMADCASQFHKSAFDYAQGSAKLPPLTGVCTPTIIDDGAIQKRQDLMDAITLYADKMTALASSGDDTTLSANSQKLATNLNSAGKSFGIAALPVEASVEAAVIAIAQMALEQRKFNDIRDAAAKMEQPLATVVEALKSENLTYALGVGSKIDGVEVQLVTLLQENAQQRSALLDSLQRPKKGPVSPQPDPGRYFDLLQAHAILYAANPMAAAPLATADAAQKSDPTAIAKSLNNALDAIVAANDAIATAGNGGIAVAVGDLIARAQAAQTMQTALNK